MVRAIMAVLGLLALSLVSVGASAAPDPNTKIVNTVESSFSNSSSISSTGHCGSNYSQFLKGYRIYSPGGSRTGTLRIYRNPSNGYKCAINHCYGSWCGIGMYRGVYIKRPEQSTPNCPTSLQCDVGYFYEYAGPAYVAADGRCITAYAWMDSNETYGQDLGAKLIVNEHCI